MGVLSILLLMVTHPEEVRALVHYKVWRDPLNVITEHPESSGWNRQSMKDCWGFLDLTSRSFAAVIKELKGEMSRVICIFYLVLRALDTIEDDMTLPADKKIQLLLAFHQKLSQPGWNFTDSGPDEKDRQLLVEFHKVIEEFQMLSSGYQTVIADITAKMGAGMASYIEASDKTPLSVITFADWDLYCHFVAGLVGEGISRLFAESGIERPWLGDQLELSNHMGLFLQKVNIIRDFAEDSEQSRFFWPKECWSAFGFASQPDVANGIIETSTGSKKFKSQGEEGARGMAVLSTMLLDAMRHSTRSLDYLAMLREQSIFNFCAIPQTMAIATIELMVNNPNVLRRNVKIRKTQAVGLIIRSVNPRDVAYMFLEFSKKIAKKIPVSDVNYVAWHVELARIETWCEHYYPSFVAPGSSAGGPALRSSGDVRAAALEQYGTKRHTMAIQRSKESGVNLFSAEKQRQLQMEGKEALDPRLQYMSEEEMRKSDDKEKAEMMRFFVIIMASMALLMGAVALTGWYIAWYLNSSDTDPLTLQIIRMWRFLTGGQFYHSLPFTPSAPPLPRSTAAVVAEAMKEKREAAGHGASEAIAWAGGKVQEIRTRYDL